MREKTRLLIGAVAALSVAALSLLEVVPAAGAAALPDRAGIVSPRGEWAFPFAGALKFPFTKHDSLKCGRWAAGSQDYPFFGAPRDGTARRHGGIDLYPVHGAGAPVEAIRDGRVIRISPFYKRHNGEMTYAVLVDHGEFVANYAELAKPAIDVGAVVPKNGIIGFLSGTKHLHFELYTPGTRGWMSWSWYGEMPKNLIDPTDMMRRAGARRSGSPRRPVVLGFDR